MGRRKKGICRYAEYSYRTKCYRCNQMELTVDICPYRQKIPQNWEYRCTDPEITRMLCERK